MKYLFDLDDTLVNTSQVVYRSMQEWCALHGIDLELAIDIGKGRRTEETVALLAPSLNAKQEAKWIEELESELAVDIQPMVGAVEFVSKLSEFSWAIVTSSSHDLALKKLSVCNFPMPEVLVSADSVVLGKPNSEPYILAMELLGVSPNDCLVFEDAESGVISAIGAGCKVIVVGDYTGEHDLNIAGRISSFDQLDLSHDGIISIDHQYT